MKTPEPPCLCDSFLMANGVHDKACEWITWKKTGIRLVKINVLHAITPIPRSNRKSSYSIGEENDGVGELVVGDKIKVVGIYGTGQPGTDWMPTPDPNAIGLVGKVAGFKTNSVTGNYGNPWSMYDSCYGAYSIWLDVVGLRPLYWMGQVYVHKIG